MRKFVAGKNIQRYQALLDQETDPVRRHTLEQLLAEEHSAKSALDQTEEGQTSPPQDPPKT